MVTAVYGSLCTGFRVYDSAFRVGFGLQYIHNTCVVNRFDGIAKALQTKKLTK